MGKFVLTKKDLMEIENELDDTAGHLVKMSTLKWLIERYVNRELKEKGKNK